MYIIKNRVNGEYDRKGLNCFSKVKRGAWDKIGHAKNHVILNLDSNSLDWYIDADFIEIDETGTKSVTPVVDYLREYYSSLIKNKYHHVSDKTLKKLGLEVSND